MSRNIKVTLIVLVVLALAGAAYGFAAANTFGGNVPANVGYVAAEVSGFEISNIQVTTDGEDVTTIEFDTAPTAKFVSVQTRGDVTAWDDCVMGEALLASHATCTFTGDTALSMHDYTTLNITASNYDNQTEGQTIIRLNP